MPIICRHKNLSFPQTPVRQENGRRVVCGEPTTVCLACGRRFSFDAVEWQIGREIIDPRPAAKVAGA